MNCLSVTAVATDCVSVPGALARFTLPPPKTPKSLGETEVLESVPDSQANAEEETRRFGWAEGATAVVDGGDGAGVAVGEALGVPVMDWHWVFHSLVYHRPLPKREYEVIERETGENQTRRL